MHPTLFKCVPKGPRSRRYRKSTIWGNFIDLREWALSVKAMGHSLAPTLFMEGMTPRRISRLRNLHLQNIINPVCERTRDSEVVVLKQCLQLYGNAIDACAGTGSLARSVVALYGDQLQEMWTQDIDVQHKGLNSYVDSLACSITGFDIIIFSPPFPMADLFLVWAVNQDVPLVIMHVAGDFFTNAPEYRRTYLQPYEHNGRLLIVNGLPLVKGRNIRRCIFLVLFRDRYSVDRHLIHGASCTVYHNK